jgi:ABC-type sugar transport system permease subunit
VSRPGLSPYAFVAFPLAILAVFSLAPTAAGLALSLFNWNGSGIPRFVGLENFRGLFSDPRFTPALRNTLLFVLGTVPASTFLGFLLAVAVHAKWFVGRTLARSLFFLPTVISIVAIGFVWRWLLNDQGGLVPAFLRAIGISRPPNLLQEGSWPLVSIIIVQIWRGVGFCMVLYLAALSNVNESLYEAAEVDGADRPQVLRHITWPQVAPTTVFLLVTGVIGALQVFDIVWGVTAGTETDSCNVLNLYVLREFQHSRLGYAAAIGVVIFLLTLAATGTQLAVLRRRSA